MAVEVEASGQVDEFLRVLRKRIWWIVVPFVLIGSLGCFFAVVVPKKFVSETEIMVRDPGSTTELVRARGGPSEGKVAPFTIKADARIREVLASLNWSDFRALSGPQLGEYVRDRNRDVRVQLEEMPKDVNEQLVKISYRDTNPDRATQLLIELLKSWTDDVLRSKLAAAERELAATNSELENTKEDLQRIGEEMESLRAENGIPPRSTSAIDPLGQASPPVFGQLEASENEVASLESKVAELESLIEVRQAERDSLPERVPAPDVAPSDPVQQQIAVIDREIAKLQGEIELNGWSPLSTEYKRRRRRIESAEEQKRELIAQSDGESSFTPGFSGDTVPNEARLRLDRELVAMQAEKQVASRRLERERERYLTLKQRADIAYGAMEQLQFLDAQHAALRETLTQLEIVRQENTRKVEYLDGPQGDPFRVQLRPTVPTEATSPNPWIISIGSLLFGLGIGFGLALLREYSKAVFRTPRDIARVMPHPVLGRVNTIRTRRERARAFLVQCVFGGGSLLFALSTAYVTWSWARDREGLTRPLVDAIESFQQLLK